MRSRRGNSSFNALRRLTRREARAEAVERCELCSAQVPPRHRHLLEMTTREVMCACDPCALRFQHVIGGRFKLIPRDARALPDFRMTDAQWERFALPINLAFFFYSTPEEKMTTLYPSPAGATESLLPLKAWGTLVEENPALAQMKPDVEALLVNRTGKRRAYYLAPIDTCYQLVGLIRLHWKGLSGGEAVWKEIERFFVRLEKQARPVAEAPQEEEDHA